MQKTNKLARLGTETTFLSAMNYEGGDTLRRTLDELYTANTWERSAGRVQSVTIRLSDQTWRLMVISDSATKQRKLSNETLIN